MVSLQNLSFKYDDWIFRDVSCEISSRKTGIIGVNGAGKTTLLRLISGDLTPQSGQIAVPGRPYFVDFAVRNYRYFTPRELFALCSSLNGFHDIFDDLTQVLGFGGMMDVCLEKLSLGSLKKVFLMLGFACDCGLLLLDEPFESLDETSCQNLAAYIGGCEKEMMVVSHNVSLLRTCVESVYEVSDGKLIPG